MTRKIYEKACKIVALDHVSGGFYCIVIGYSSCGDIADLSANAEIPSSNADNIGIVTELRNVQVLALTIAISVIFQRVILHELEQFY